MPADHFIESGIILRIINNTPPILSLRSPNRSEEVLLLWGKDIVYVNRAKSQFKKKVGGRRACGRSYSGQVPGPGRGPAAVPPLGQ
jgi:hypothetical protein